VTRVGETVFIFCNYHNVSWSFDTPVGALQPIVNIIHSKRIINDTSVSYLRIANVSEVNEGMYYCQEKNSNKVVGISIIDIVGKRMCHFNGTVIIGIKSVA